MNGPTHIEDGAEPGDGPDELERAYQRASERAAVRPGPQVREAILAQARRAAAASAHQAGVSPPAANDARWHWQAAASVAAVGLVGLLSWHFARVAPPSPAPAPAAAVPTIAPPAPLVASGAKQPAAAPVAMPPIPEQPRASAAPPAAAALRAPAPAAALGARATMRAAEVEVSGAARGWPDRVLRTARELYPALFAGASSAAAHPPVTVTIALNPDGSLYASTQGATVARLPEQRDAAALVAQAFGIAAGSLAQSGVIAPSDGAVIVYGIRAEPRRDTPGSP
jgi:hypothetical protein